MSYRSSFLSAACPVAVVLSMLMVGNGVAQDAGIDVEQMMTDADALVVGIDVTTRCAVFDTSVSYLSPLEQVAAEIRLGEIISSASNALDDAPDRIAQMRAAAAEQTCGTAGLAPYMDFSRQIARDVIDIALVAWKSIDVPGCNYFADEDFMRAAELASSQAQQATLEGEANRVAYIEQRGAVWSEVFAANCANLGFEPAKTLPGQIALALPTD